MNQVKLSLVTAAGLAAGFVVLNADILSGKGELALPAISDDSPRGIRNQNPGNIEFNAANKWRGQVGSDGRFSIFDSPVNGIRAMAKLLNNYRENYGINTIYGVVSRWAPDNENNTAAYISSVSRRMGIDPLADIGEDIEPLIAAIIHHENGRQPYTSSVIRAGIEAA